MKDIKINTEKNKNWINYLNMPILWPLEDRPKNLIQAGKVMVNGEEELRRGRKLVPGDEVQLVGENTVYRVTRD